MSEEGGEYSSQKGAASTKALRPGLKKQHGSHVTGAGEGGQVKTEEGARAPHAEPCDSRAYGKPLRS